MGHRVPGVGFEGHRIEALVKGWEDPKLKSWVLAVIESGIMVTGFRNRSHEIKMITSRLLDRWGNSQE